MQYPGHKVGVNSTKIVRLFQIFINKQFYLRYIILFYFKKNKKVKTDAQPVNIFFAGPDFFVNPINLGFLVVSVSPGGEGGGADIMCVCGP